MLEGPTAADGLGASLGFSRPNTPPKPAPETGGTDCCGRHGVFCPVAPKGALELAAEPANSCGHAEAPKVLAGAASENPSLGAVAKAKPEGDG